MPTSPEQVYALARNIRLYQEDDEALVHLRDHLTPGIRKTTPLVELVRQCVQAGRKTVEEKYQGMTITE